MDGVSICDSILCWLTLCQVCTCHTCHCSHSTDGVPGLVTVEVEPFTTTSVRIRWDPPTQPNDDIELLTYDVYFTQRGTSSSKTFDITSLSPQETRAWNERSFIIEQLSLDDSVVAVVVARSPQGEGARPSPEQAAVGFTFGEGENACMHTINMPFCV